ncbi:MAG TPA: hypothetical protein VFH51_12475 [Myxococcota bacterium]|nr:hypothetical protein [Myxococcota bacterium]
MPQPALRVLIGSSLCLLQACANFSLPQAVIPQSPTARDFPDAGAVVLEDNATLEFRVMDVPGTPGGKRLVAVLDHRRRMKVLSEAGLDAAGVELPIDGYSVILRAIGRSVSPDGAEQTITSGSLQARPHKDPSHGAPEVRLLRFDIPGARVGGLVEYRYERVFIDPAMVPPWVFGAARPVLHSEFALVTSPEVDLDYHFGRGEKEEDKAPLRRTTDDGRDRLVFIETDLPAYFDEPNMPHITRLAPWIGVSLRKTRLGSKAQRFESWNDVGAAVVERMLQVGGKPGSGSVAARFAAVRGTLKPLALPGLGVRQPIKAEALKKGSPACTRDAVGVLMRALEGAEADAYPVLLTGQEGPPASEGFPALYPFTRAAVAVVADKKLLGTLACSGQPWERDPLCDVKPGSYLFLDPACTMCRFGTLPTGYSGTRALLLKGKGEGRWITVPAQAPGQSSLVVQGQLSLEVDGKLTGTLDAKAQGGVAERWRTSLATAIDDEARGQAVLWGLLGEADAPRLGNFKIGAALEPDVPLTVQASVSITLPRKTYDHFTLRPVDIVGSSLPSYWRGARRYAASVAGPRWEETTVDIALPVGYGAAVPAPVRLGSEFAEYASGFSLKGRTLTYARRLVLKVPVVPSAGWGEFHDFFEQIRMVEGANLDLLSQE